MILHKSKLLILYVTNSVNVLLVEEVVLLLLLLLFNKINAGLMSIIHSFKNIKNRMGPNFWPVLYAHINQTLSKLISLLFDDVVIICCFI